MSYARWLGKGFWGKHLKRRARTCHFFFISPPSQPLGTGVPGPRTLQTVRGSGHGRCETVRRRPVPLPCMGLSATGPTRTCQQQIPPRPAAAPPTPSRAGPQNQPAAGGASLPPQREATMATGAVLRGSCPARHADTRGWSGAVARGRGQHTESRTPGHTDAKRCLKPDSDWRPAKSSTFTILLGRRRGSWSDLELSWQRLAG